MIFILSPAKRMYEIEHAEPVSKNLTTPVFLEETKILLQQLVGYSPQALASLMKISDSLAWKNMQRYQAMVLGQAKHYRAVELFAGDVYRGLDYSNLAPAEKAYVQQHSVILSGLYGVLKPNDGICPYRLEMGTALKFSHYNNLYEFWQEPLSAQINQLVKAAKPQILINLASQEYSTVLDLTKFTYQVITPTFKKIDHKTGKFRVVGVLAKYARGLMLRYAAQQQVTEAEMLKSFNEENYTYRPDLSTDTEWVFTQSA